MSTQYRMKQGYAFAVERDGATPPPWRRIANDDWETIIVDEEETEHTTFVGIRPIDGTPCAVFVAPEGRRYVYLAQTATHCRVLDSAAHETNGAGEGG